MSLLRPQGWETGSGQGRCRLAIGPKVGLLVLLMPCKLFALWDFFKIKFVEIEFTHS